MFTKHITALIFLSGFVLRKCESDQIPGRVLFKPVQNWPQYGNFGQVSAVDIDAFDNVYVFHRVNRRWDYTTFTNDNVFAARDRGPISGETIVVLDSSTGSLITKTGRNKFYLPHGLTIDYENNIWVTDVALHQVFKFPPLKFPSNGTINLENPLITLGVALEPGSDDTHFCKPTDVAVDKETNDFFVSDGYCNSRIIKYNKHGKKILSWGRSTIGDSRMEFFMLNVPHSLSLAQGKPGTLYVADRENFRVLSYDSDRGMFKKVFSQGLGNRTFSVAHFPHGKIDFILILINDMATRKMVTIQATQTEDIKTSSEYYFTSPHDIAISTNGKFCYVVELDPYKVWKLEIDFNEASFGPVKNEKPSTEGGEKSSEFVSERDKLSSMGQLEGSSTYLAVGLVAFVVVVSFIFFMFHFNRRKAGYKRYELRRLILDDEDESMGIRLT